MMQWEGKEQKPVMMPKVDPVRLSLWITYKVAGSKNPHEQYYLGMDFSAGVKVHRTRKAAKEFAQDEGTEFWGVVVQEVPISHPIMKLI